MSKVSGVNYSITQRQCMFIVYSSTQDDKLVLCELQRFLRPFHDLTELVSSEQPHLGLVPLIIREVKDAAKLHAGDSEIIYQLKKAIANRLP